jgi:hypothetical protein
MRIILAGVLLPEYYQPEFIGWCRKVMFIRQLCWNAWATITRPVSVPNGTVTGHLSSNKFYPVLYVVRREIGNKKQGEKKMKEQTEKQVIQYAEKTLPELLALALTGDKLAAEEIVTRQEKQAAEIEQLKVKANSKRAPRAEKTPEELATDNAYFRTALLVKQFGSEAVDLQTLTVASAFLGQGLAQGNLRQALNRVTQVIKAQAVEETVFPAWIVTAAGEIPQLDENKKLEEEGEKVEQIRSIIEKYTVVQETPAPAPAPAAQAPAEAQANKKKGNK